METMRGASVSRVKGHSAAIALDGKIKPRDGSATTVSGFTNRKT